MAPIVEGVFAIHKPSSLSSAQVIRDAQAAFRDSKLFQPWFERERKNRDVESHNQKQKRRSWKSRQALQLKMGHGGTLDPMATGVLILGIGNGTKSLNSFLQCTKSYECVVLFGAASDSYDSMGKIVARKDYSHITKNKVEEALSKFRGDIMQKPSIFSALKVNGKKMYEYAREGKELPIEIEARAVQVQELELTEWMEGGEHDFNWPTEEAPEREKEVLDKALKLEEKGAKLKLQDGEGEVAVDAGAKRKRDDTGNVMDEQSSASSPKRRKSEERGAEPTMSGALPNDAELSVDAAAKSIDTTRVSRCPAPACRLRMTVTSGFYVRSLCHDLGEAVGSLALMGSLVRTRQGDFSLDGQKGNVLDYEDLGKGEETWGEKVAGMLKAWDETSGERSGEKIASRVGGVHGSASKGKKKSPPKKRRRNSSSDESSGAAGHGAMLAFADGDDGDGVGFDDGF